MKNKIIFLLILLIPATLAMPILKFQNNQTQPGETVLATITTKGEFISQIEKSQIKFFEGRKQTTLESDILFYNKTYYLYIYTTKEENLTFQIRNILYKEAGTLKSITISKNLTIQKNILINEDTNETYTQILKIKPGFIFSSASPKLKLTNTGTSDLNITFNKEEISIPSLTSQYLEFTPKESFSLAKISTYKDFQIPIVYITSKENTTLISPAIKLSLRPNPELLLVEIFTKSKSKKRIELFNFASTNITDLKATSSLDFIKIENLQDMLGRGIQNLTLELNPKLPGHFQGKINVSYTQNKIKQLLQIPLSIFVLPKGTINKTFQIKEETCKEISGQVCSQKTLCNGTAIFTKNAEYCCLDSCIQIEKESKSKGFGWLIAIVIFIILGLTGYYFYKKQKLLQSPKPKDALQATTEKFEKRLAGRESQKTKNNLTKF